MKLAAVPRQLERNRSTQSEIMAQTHPSTRVHVCSLYVFPIDGTVVAEMLLPPTPHFVGTVIIVLEVAAYYKIVVNQYTNSMEHNHSWQAVSKEMVHSYRTRSCITAIGLYPEPDGSRPHRHT